jgi:apolipoprotein N-acyltransferase
VTVLATPRRLAPHGPPARRSRPAAPFLALAAGGLLYAATPPVGWWPAAPLAVAALAVAVRDAGVRRAFVLGLLTGLGYLVPLYAWARAPGVDLWLLLAAFEAVLFAPTAVGLALTSRLRAAPLWGSGVWVLDEALRDSWPFGGLAWARLAFTQPATPYTRWATVGGAPLVTAVVALSGLLLAAAVAGKRLWVLALAAGVGAAGLAVPLASQRGPTLAVAIVQGNVPRAGFDVFRQRTAVLANHVQQTLTLAREVRLGLAPQPQLVIWPEDADDLDPFTDRAAYDQITVAAAAIRAPILLGAVLDGSAPHTLANTALLFTGDGYAGQQYVKQHPVPFGEYLPYRSVLEHLSGRATTLLPEDDVRGLTSGEFHTAGTTVGDVICFEVSDDTLVRRTVDGGARLLVVQTNNATFGHGGETWQQLAMARLRAVEHDRTVLVGSTSGVSAVIDAHGHVIRRSGLFEPALLSADVHLDSGRTLVDRMGSWPGRALGVLGLVGLALGLIAPRRRRADGEVQT